VLWLFSLRELLSPWKGKRKYSYNHEGSVKKIQNKPFEQILKYAIYLNYDLG
jgi:hypothetical protein